MRSGVALAVVGLLAAGCVSTTGTREPGVARAGRTAPLAIEHPRVEPKTLDLTGRADATARVSFDTTQPAQTQVEMVDEAGNVVWRETSGQPVQHHTVAWNGRGPNGEPVASGVYRYRISAHTAAGAQAQYDPFLEGTGEELAARDFTWDKQTGFFHWVMPRAGFARLRVGILGFPHLRTLLDWQPIEGGEQQLAWDGLDSSGLIKVKDHPNMAFSLAAFSMPSNSIIVKSNAATAVSVPPAASTAPVGPYFHAKHARSICHEARLTVAFAQEGTRDAQGRAIVSGNTPVRVAVDARDAEHLQNQRFELGVYEDLIMLFEEEESTTPFTFLWDTSRLTPGEHLLTINILSYDDHFGVATLPVIVKGQQQ